MRVIVTTRQGARFTERVACETDDADRRAGMVEMLRDCAI